MGYRYIFAMKKKKEGLNARNQLKWEKKESEVGFVHIQK